MGAEDPAATPVPQEPQAEPPRLGGRRRAGRDAMVLAAGSPERGQCSGSASGRCRAPASDIERQPVRARPGGTGCLTGSGRRGQAGSDAPPRARRDRKGTRSSGRSV